MSEGVGEWNHGLILTLLTPPFKTAALLSPLSFNSSPELVVPKHRLHTPKTTQTHTNSHTHTHNHTNRDKCAHTSTHRERQVHPHTHTYTYTYTQREDGGRERRVVASFHSVTLFRKKMYRLELNKAYTLTSDIEMMPHEIQ